MKTFFIDRITVLAIIIPMIVLILIGYLSYENTIKFIQKNTFTDRTNLIIQKLEHLASTTSEVRQASVVL